MPAPDESCQALCEHALALLIAGDAQVLLAQGQVAQALQLCLVGQAELQQQFSALRFEGSADQDVGCNFSAGVAVSTSADDTLPALLARADAALYRAKAAGRARVALAPAA